MSGKGPLRQARPISEFGDVYGFLGEVRLRPGMWVPDGSLRHLQSMLIGYRVALEVHAIADPFDFWTDGPFAEWLWKRLGRHSPLGWGAEIEREASSSGRAPLDEFFVLLDEYRGRAQGRPAELPGGLRSAVLGQFAAQHADDSRPAT
jgi:hypothetical protein